MRTKDRSMTRGCSPLSRLKTALLAEVPLSGGTFGGGRALPRPHPLGLCLGRLGVR